jgi:transposase
MRTKLSVCDHAEERSWRHLDWCGFTTWLHARAPRVSCPEHGVRQVRLAWAEPHARFTALFERLAIDVLKETDITGACRILQISWDEGWHLMQRAVARGMASKQRRVPALMGVDEKAAAKGQRYITLVCDLEAATVQYIADDRKQASLDGYFEPLTEPERAQIKAVAMDMWEPYVNSVCAHLPDAETKIVFDRFHIMKHMVESVDTVRKREHRALIAQGQDLLTGSKVPVAVLAGEPPRATPGAVRGAEGDQPQDRPGVGDQGKPTRAVALPPPRLGTAVLQALVLLGHPLTATARD